MTKATHRSVDNDDMITAVNARVKNRLVLALQQLDNLGSNATRCLHASVNLVPDTRVRQQALQIGEEGYGL